MTEGKGVRFELNAGEAIGALSQAAARAERPRDLFETIGQSLVTSTQRRFETGRSPAGNPWPPSIRAIAEGGQTLVDTGGLVGSITYEASDTGVAVGTNAIHAAVHQFGAVIRPVNALKLRFVIGGRVVFADQSVIPARPYLGLDEDDETKIEAIAGDFLGAPLGGVERGG